MKTNKIRKNEYILFELIEWGNGEIDYRTKPVSEHDDEYIVYEQFAKEKHCTIVDDMDLIPHIIEDENEEFKCTMIVMPLDKGDKKKLADIQVEMYEFLREYK